MLNKAIIINNQIVLKDMPEKPTIIIDKSTLETLSNAESNCLGRYYLAVSTHVLFSEIGADLKKNFDKDFDGTRTPEEVVSVLARRMHGLYRFNTDWSTLLGLSLLGHKIPTEGMAPVYVDGIETYIPGIGLGIYFNEQKGRKTLFAWGSGDFSESDYQMAERWHSEIENIDLTRLQNLGNKLKRLKAKSLEDIPTTVENLLNDSQYHFELLQFLVKLSQVPEEISTAIFNRWNKDGMPRIRNFSEYGCYCLKVYLIFQWALFSGLIGTRSTNWIDLHYLFELPFCRIFSSNDRFHAKFAPLLMTDQQIFIKGSDLKSDLKRIEEYVDSVREEGPFPFPYPPDWNDSFTNQVWRECVMPREEYAELTEEEKENILRMLRKFEHHNLEEPGEHDG